MKSRIREILVILTLAIVTYIAAQFTFQGLVTVGSSMEPTYQEHQQLLVNKVVYHFHPPQRGDIVAFWPSWLARSWQRCYVKRIIALPGETVTVEDGVVCINGKRLKEPYVSELTPYVVPPTEVPEDSYFVLSDNRHFDSIDSHLGWTVPHQRIMGKVWLSVWPPSQWGIWEKLIAATIIGLLLLMVIRKRRLLLYVGLGGLCLLVVATVIKTFS